MLLPEGCWSAMLPGSQVLSAPATPAAGPLKVLKQLPLPPPRQRALEVRQSAVCIDLQAPGPGRLLLAGAATLRRHPQAPALRSRPRAIFYL